jgi:hypothetical protein
MVIFEIGSRFLEQVGLDCDPPVLGISHHTWGNRHVPSHLAFFFCLMGSREHFCLV